MEEVPETPKTVVSDVPEEFAKVMKDFLRDMINTFPEYRAMVAKYWKPENEVNSLKFLFKFCKKKYPPRFFDILYRNEDIFAEGSEIDTEFLPFIHFKDAWKFDVSPQTKETMWKYLQLITFSIVGSIEDKEAFGDTAKLFEAIDNDNFKSKIEETMGQLFESFNQESKEQQKQQRGEQEQTDGNPTEGGAAAADDPFQMPSADDIHGKINEMMGGKLGALAKEIAEEAASNIGIDFSENADMKEVFGKLIKNPTKLMGLVKTVGTKLEDKIKNGEIKESELMQEASEMLTKMKNMPGMGNIQSMLNKMGMGSMGGKMNFGAMKTQMDANLRKAKMKERMRTKMEQNQSKFSTGEKAQKTPRGAKPPPSVNISKKVDDTTLAEATSPPAPMASPMQKPQKKKGKTKAAAALQAKTKMTEEETKS